MKIDVDGDNINEYKLRWYHAIASLEGRFFILKEMENEFY